MNENIHHRPTLPPDQVVAALTQVYRLLLRKAAERRRQKLTQPTDSLKGIVEIGTSSLPAPIDQEVQENSASNQSSEKSVILVGLEPATASE